MNHPNLLFLYTDEQAFSTLATYGNTQIQMPNLNRLAASSTVIDECYVTQPVCTPSRSTLLTGLYPHTNGCTENNVPLCTEIPCLPEMLSAGNYRTAHYGKWHLGDELFAQHGFDEWISIEDGYNRHFREGRDQSTTSSYHDFLTEKGLTPKHGERFGRGEATRLPEELGKPAFLAREASGFIRSNQERPFMLFVNFLEPHMPFYGPRDDQYCPDDIPLPPNNEAFPGPSAPLKARLLQRHYADHDRAGLTIKPEDGGWRRLIANYWGLCSLVDTHVGTILDGLRDSGQWDNTIIVFTSDHGDMMGAHGLVAKCVMYQEAVRVPLIMKLPGQAEGTRVSGPVSQVDVVPTLLDLMEQPIPPELQGKSLRPWLENPERKHAEDVFIEWNGPNCGIPLKDKQGRFPAWQAELTSPEGVVAACRDQVRSVITADGWKLNWSPNGEHELYNLRNDPSETVNRFGKDETRTVVTDLVARIRDWQQRTADKTTLPAP